MCGLAGIHLDEREAYPDRRSIEQMVTAIGHRGPDGVGFHIEAGLGLGHARLSIIDLAGGRQPIHNEDETIWVSFNGEIFNYIELRRFLELKGHRFYTNTDTEVIVHLYEELGDRFVEELNGQFAIALWDRNKRRLLLVRDRAGILPLYYTRTKRGTLFASEVKALLASGEVTAAVDPNGLSELMTFWAPLAPRTMFEGIEQVCPGEMVILMGAGIDRRVFWRWDFPTQGEHRHGHAEELQEALREQLTSAAEIRLRADVPVGAYLSGGLDSASLVALISKRLPQGLQTFSIGFDDANLDESIHQQAVVQYLHTTHHHMQCSRQDIAMAFPDTILHTESPVLRTAPTPMGLLSSLVRRQNVKVVLTGEGADEVLGGYDIFKEAKVRHFWARQPSSSWRPALLKRLYPYLDLTSSQSAAYLREFFGLGLDHPNDPFFSHLPRWATTAQCKLFWSDEFRDRVSVSPLDNLRSVLPERISEWHPFNRGEYLEARTLLPSYLLCSQGDRMLMSNSVEGRFPFLDHRLIEFANELHPKYKMRVLREKDLFKQTMKQLVPTSILNRHKQPYRAPDAAAFLGPNTPAYVTELMSKEYLNRYRYFDAEKVERLVTKLRRSSVVSARDNMAFVGVLSTQLWHSHFIAGGSHSLGVGARRRAIN